MCGIAGIISKNENLKNKFIEKVPYLIAHRGSDSSDVFFHKDIAIYHRRLSIVGSSVGVQPIESHDQNIVAAVNGEFYDYQEIKNKYPYRYKTDSDSEIVIPLYEKYGLDFAKYLKGEFAVSILDLKQRKLILVRDHMGVKPMYYKINDKYISFASEIKAFLSLSKMDFDEETLKTVLACQYHNTSKTLFKDVFQVPPGSMVIISLDNLDVVSQKYWDLSYTENNEISFDEAKIEVRNKLYQAVEKRIFTNKTIGYTLSGGIDSSAIFSLASQISNKKLDAYSISFSDQNYNEEILAKKMAEKYDGNFNAIRMDTRDLLDNLENSIYHAEQICINNHVAAKYTLFKNISKDGHKISLSGEGSDEIFLGYSHFLADNQDNLDSFKYLKGMHLPDGQILDVNLNQKMYVPTFLKAKLSLGMKLSEVLTPEAQGGRENAVYAHYDYSPRFSHNVYNAAYLWSKVSLSNYILNALGDKMEMASTIEGRVPFLDIDLVNFVNTLPVSFKINNGIEKYILKESVKNDVIEEIYSKRKHPFIGPPILSGTKEGTEFVRDIVNSNSLKNHPIWKQSSLIKLLETPPSQTKDSILMIFLSLYFLEKSFVNP